MTDDIRLCLVPSDKYNERIIKILKKIKNKLVYLAVNRPSSQVMQDMKKAGINPNKVFFVDCVSKNIEESKDNVIFLETAQSLTSISLSLNTAIDHIGSDSIIIVDSLTSLIMYNDPRTVSKFSNYMINKMRSYGHGMVIFALESNTNRETIDQISTIVDKVEIIK